MYNIYYPLYIYVYKKQSKVQRNAKHGELLAAAIFLNESKENLFFSSSPFHLCQEMSVRRGKTVGTRQKWGVQSHKSKKMITTTTTKKKRKRIRERRYIVYFMQ